ncbi:hypothetical protein BT96DRAFT_990023 [Gymnopus androsaceus JB14]|uniref:Uncharacterized protein n=1 Tax=Gymnopus androsaceus JB14 TaxID=1447944 RepID=A0A6A4HYG0_9AGAR|nr:hypothetical protein BT96DRAFT_990023 [Gymnopus androsaceus JB14]
MRLTAKKYPGNTVVTREKGAETRKQTNREAYIRENRQKTSSVQLVVAKTYLLVMPPPPAFSKLRIKFLTEAGEKYGQTTDGVDWNSFVVQMVRRFIKRFPLHLGDKEDPSMESYNAIDDSVVDPKVPMPELGTEEYKIEAAT